MSYLKETSIEKALIKKVKDMGGLAIKLTSPSMVGLPDRIILMPKEKIGFVELKAKGKKPRSIQLKRINKLRTLGFKVFVLDDKKDIEKVIDEIKGGD